MAKKNLFKAGILGGATGGLVSALVSSPQSQIYWWQKEPGYRWNLVLWDTVAGMSVCGIMYWFTGSKKWLYLAGGIGVTGGALTVALKQNPNWPGPPEQASL